MAKFRISFERQMYGQDSKPIKYTVVLDLQATTLTQALTEAPSKIQELHQISVEPRDVREVELLS